MIKKLLYGCAVFLLVLGILLPGMAGNAYAAKFSGTAGEGIYWSFREETGVLMVYGAGEMPDYSETAAYYPPWEKWDSAIRDLVIAEGITSVGAEAFRGCFNLMSVTFPSTVKVKAGSVRAIFTRAPSIILTTAWPRLWPSSSGSPLCPIVPMPGSVT